MVNRFTYLGSTLSQNATIDVEVNVRIAAKASATLGRLHANVWNSRGIGLLTKLKVYRAIVLTPLLYTCDTWTVYRRHARKLNHFHTAFLKKTSSTSNGRTGFQTLRSLPEQACPASTPS